MTNAGDDTPAFSHVLPPEYDSIADVVAGILTRPFTTFVFVRIQPDGAAFGGPQIKTVTSCFMRIPVQQIMYNVLLVVMS